MKKCSELLREVNAGKFDGAFDMLYPGSPVRVCRERYAGLIELFIGKYGDREAVIVSAPGRTEIGGNHTDHQRGNVLAASVSLDTVCVAAPNGEETIRVQSVGYPPDEIDLDRLEIHPEETGKAASLIRGIARWFKDRDAVIGGFDAYTASDVLSGSGLSSSAAFEVVIGTAISRLFAPLTTPEEIAFAGQYAENEYFGKPSGLMDQMASSVGGFVHIDFLDPKNPVIKPIKCNLKDLGYNLCIVNTRGSHADLTPDYAAIPAEMRRVAVFFGKEYLREVNKSEFFEKLPEVRQKAGDRAVLRAMHYFRDNEMAVESASALKHSLMALFLSNISRSGQSSFMYLQNVFSPRSPEQQGLTLALELCERLLGFSGAWRVHGGGFAGTVQAFVPDDRLENFILEQDRLFGAGACQVLSVRPVGGVQVSAEGVK